MKKGGGFDIPPGHNFCPIPVKIPINYNLRQTFGNFQQGESWVVTDRTTDLVPRMDGYVSMKKIGTFMISMVCGSIPWSSRMNCCAELILIAPQLWRRARGDPFVPNSWHRPVRLLPDLALPRSLVDRSVTLSLLVSQGFKISNLEKKKYVFEEWGQTFLLLQIRNFNFDLWSFCVDKGHWALGNQTVHVPGWYPITRYMFDNNSQNNQRPIHRCWQCQERAPSSLRSEIQK